MPYRLAYKANRMEHIPQLTLPGVDGGTQTLAHKGTIHTENPLKKVKEKCEKRNTCMSGSLRMGF